MRVARSLLALESSITHLLDALTHDEITTQIEGAANPRSAVRKLCDAYSTIDYKMQDEVNSGLVTLGVAGVSADILKSARRVNQAKAEFKATCTPLQGIRVRIPVKGEQSPTKAIPAIRVILRNIQRSDLNLLAAYRKIPILDAPAAKVIYTRANTRAVYKKSVEEIAAMLSHMQ
jgi:hypothetical protein